MNLHCRFPSHLALSFKFQSFIKISFNSSRSLPASYCDIVASWDHQRFPYTIAVCVSSQHKIKFDHGLRAGDLGADFKTFTPDEHYFRILFRIDRRFHVKRNFSIFCLLHSASNWVSCLDFDQEANMFSWIRTILCTEYEIKHIDIEVERGKEGKSKKEQKNHFSSTLDSFPSECLCFEHVSGVFESIAFSSQSKVESLCMRNCLSQSWEKAAMWVIYKWWCE